MKENKKSSISVSAAFGICLGIFLLLFTLPVRAAETGTITVIRHEKGIALDPAGRIRPESGAPLVGVRYRAWRVSSETREQTDEARAALLEKWAESGESTLEASFGAPFLSAPSDAVGRAVFHDLPDGLYYIREIPVEGRDRAAPMLAVVSSTERAVVLYVKPFLPQEPEVAPGKLVIRKVDEKGKPLVGAVFTLTWLKTGEVLTFDQIHGAYVPDVAKMRTTLSSGRDGQIVVEALSAGRYVLEETEAPAGYLVNSEESTMRVEVRSGEETVLTVVNRRIPDKPPEKPKTPKTPNDPPKVPKKPGTPPDTPNVQTGDRGVLWLIGLFLLASAGLALIQVMKKREKKERAENGESSNQDESNA